MDFKKSLIEETIFEGRPPVWLRGTVEKMYRNSYQVVLKYIVYLVDYGAIVSLNALDGKVCVLPKKFIQHPPMVCTNIPSGNLTGRYAIFSKTL